MPTLNFVNSLLTQDTFHDERLNAHASRCVFAAATLLVALTQVRVIPETLDGIIAVLRREGINFEIVVVNDNSRDNTRQLVLDRMRRDPEMVLVNNTPPGGFGRAIRAGLRHFSGDAVAIVMADCSDDPEDLVRCYRKLLEGYDCVFGSRFRPESTVTVSVQ
jgi:dolichol-phosphate mannosyltransferase